MPHKHRWIAALLPLALAASVWAAEPAPSAQAEPQPVAPLPTFDLKSESVRKLVRATASTQANTDYRVETSKPPRLEVDLAAALRVDRPATKKTVAPRLPERPPPCDGFWSCGIETLLGLEDFDDEVYGRVERHRLMNQGSFTDSSKINASVALPIPAGSMSNVGPLKPR